MAHEGGAGAEAGGGGREHAAFLGTRSFASLDGLRALSIIAVVWHHAHKGFAGWPITVRGFLGVDLFFVISGFLIVTLLLRERRRSGAISLRGFYVRRFLRIFPAYYGTLAVVAALAFLTPLNTAPAMRRDLPYAMVYVTNLVEMSSMLFITWSLSTEEQFYLVIPALERYARRAAPFLLPALYVLASLPPFGVFASWQLPWFFRETTFGPILLGVMLAHVLDDARGYRWVSRWLAHPASPVAASALVVLACSVPGENIQGWPRLAIQWSLLLLVATCVVRERHALLPLLSLWPLRRIGIVSYGIYLFHLFVMHGVAAALRRAGVVSEVAVFVGTALGTWGVAELSYRFYESRFLALKARFEARPAALAPAAPGSAAT